MINSVIPRIYTGESEFDGREPYIPSPELIEAVNLTIFLQKRPLLLKGEPGCGKTRLARAVADELGLPYESWYIQSTSRAKDGFYTYDAIARLQDAQIAQHDEQRRSKVNDPKNYIKLGPLGRAFQNSLDNSQRTVVLIDEIDKADIDFPNDLLQALDEGRFTIQETGEEIKANPDYLPIIFITSNDEKDLPDAFLRRCLFHYIKFPQESELINIINAHFQNSKPSVIAAAVRRFQLLRNNMEKNIGKTGKKVSTSELIDWFTILREYPEDEILSKLEGELPFAGVLLKYWKDYRDYLLPSREEKNESR
ncbi:MoxR family ATPase [Sphaerospermopsis aphanizomenoides BCCUSP55]|uniref:AAA family ATPase n=1 Tax=Sphaerospermopsis aphanizomenoides TaxID=459663 RepID=UPI001906385B|nr:MoxR family ATPase [Sphaerospermopsis aphanizomenoides]MBK1989694.1 MoxR family ATPase [Sphaerospermopsis aphanizomenoides BCCUSP55]